jgi:hypothetical protein
VGAFFLSWEDVQRVIGLSPDIKERFGQGENVTLVEQVLPYVTISIEHPRGNGEIFSGVMLRPECLFTAGIALPPDDKAALQDGNRTIFAHFGYAYRGDGDLLSFQDIVGALRIDPTDKIWEVEEYTLEEEKECLDKLVELLSRYIMSGDLLC